MDSSLNTTDVNEIIYDENKNNDNESNNTIMKFWRPIIEVIQCVEFFCKNNLFKNILELGPGDVPFPLANVSIGCNEIIKKYINIDIDVDNIPFIDKSIDFVYARHILEDIQNPDFSMKEISRVTNSGYIETPSPLIEITKGVDCCDNSKKYTGYIHHRYIVWSNIEKCEIYFLPKYSQILDHMLVIDENNSNRMLDLIKKPIYWNNYFLWKDITPSIIMYKNGVNWDKKHMINEYIDLVVRALNESIANTNYFIKNYCPELSEQILE